MSLKMTIWEFHYLWMIQLKHAYDQNFYKGTASSVTVRHQNVANCPFGYTPESQVLGCYRTKSILNTVNVMCLHM